MTRSVSRRLAEILSPDAVEPDDRSTVTTRVLAATAEAEMQASLSTQVDGGEPEPEATSGDGEPDRAAVTTQVVKRQGRRS
jgi:hypothetical protein